MVDALPLIEFRRDKRGATFAWRRQDSIEALISVIVGFIVSQSLRRKEIGAHAKPLSSISCSQPFRSYGTLSKL